MSVFSTMRRSLKPRPRGLAPLELVMVLPVLLFIVAVIINASMGSTWKVRSLSAARDGALRSQWPRGGFHLRPESWPEGASMGRGGGGPLTVLDEPAINHPVARGPMSAAIVNENLLDPTRGGYRGNASGQWEHTVPPRFGHFSFDADFPIIDGLWPYDGTGLSDNRQRRTKVLYEFSRTDPSLVEAYIDAVVSIYYAPFQEQLIPLEHESDWPRFGYSSPDFHPRLRSFCSMDAVTVHNENVGPLLMRIRGDEEGNSFGVPETMAQAYIAHYKRVIRDAELALEELIEIGAPAGAIQAAEAELQSRHEYVDDKIVELEGFLASLRNSKPE